MIRKNLEKVLSLKNIFFVFFLGVFMFGAFNLSVSAEFSDYDYDIHVENYDLPEENYALPDDTEAVPADSKPQTASDILFLIDEYQAKYFDIVKRNNVLLNLEESAEADLDREELKELFEEVESKITNKHYLNRYKRIQKRYSNCKDTTTPGINDFAERNLEAVDDLLNDVYNRVKIKLSFDDSMKLAASKNKWQKEVTDYEKVYESMDFGTIGTSVLYSYQINMKEFRALLMMLYL